MEKYPKVLIMFETFHTRSGGGITLSNLFKGWDKKSLANVLTIHNIDKLENIERCGSYYYLGNSEFKVPFPFSMFIKVGESGKLSVLKKNPSVPSSRNLKTIIIDGLKWFMRMGISLFNLSHFLYSIDISPEFLKWIKDFSPDYIYIQPGSLADIVFFKKLHDVTGIPLVMHIMDDWVNAESSGLLKNYWKRKIDKRLRELLDVTAVYLSISEGMSEEYYNRYGKIFKPFHNTIQVDKWLPYSKKQFAIDKEIKILYAGRIGLGIYNSFNDLIHVIEELNKEQYKITINIQTSYTEPRFLKGLMKHQCVSFNPFVEYSELPKIFSSYDLLLLPIDFESKGLSFLKFSMPTKVSEFMISGTPVLLYCPKQAYLYKHAKKYNWAYIIDNNEHEKIRNGIIELITNEKIRSTISKIAVNFAQQNFNDELVRENFRLQFSKI